MNEPRILVAGIGNIFLGDDAFGVEVLQRLLRRQLPGNVRAFDFGIRGFDLVYALLDGYDAAILVDATAQGGEPGTLYTIELESDAGGQEAGPAAMEAHAMNPMRVLELARTMGGLPDRILLVGCEPEVLCEDDGGAMGLTPRVAAAVDGAIGLIESLVVRITVEHRAGAMV